MEPVVVLVEEHTDAVLLEVEVEVVDNLLLVELVVAEPPPELIVCAACLSDSLDGPNIGHDVVGYCCRVI